MPDYNAQAHIQRFLGDNPHGHLYVLVGYASVWGLAWLQENTPGRPVTLIIGDTRPHHFDSATNRDRARALQFLRRGDARTLSWYRTRRSAQGKSMLHAKGWIIAAPGERSATAALIGSANLTRAGLQDNWEMMALAADGELSRIGRQLDGLMQGRTVSRKPWDAESRLIEAIEAGRRVQELTKAMPTRQRRPPAARRRSGCLTLAAAMGVLVASIATLLLLL
ncbi:MAG: phospholipase D family protein [bacterium]|nr:phospholipase D family protein [bacterium]MDE0600338.1 phospholipase D family protein [bacterium]